LASQPRLCKIAAKSPAQGDKALISRNKRILVLCRKPEREICAGFTAVPDLSINPACMTRIVNYFNDRITDEAVDEISIVSPSATRVYVTSQVAMIKEVSQILCKFRTEVNEMKKKGFHSTCSDSDACLRNWREFIQRVADEDFASSDPIRAYISILAEMRSWSRKKGKCLKCGKDCIDFLERLKQGLLDTALISKFLDLKLTYDENDRETVYSYFFQPLVIPRVPTRSEDNSIGESRKAEEYVIGPYTVTVLANRDSEENFYSVSSLIDNDSTLHRIVAETTTRIRTIPQVTSKHVGLLSLDELLQTREREALRVIRQGFPEIPQSVASSIAKLSSYESTGIGSIAPLLIDDHVEEFFIDQPGTAVYLDHNRWGRCRTNVMPSVSELRRIETRLRAESGFRLDRLNPSLKTEVCTREFMIRASLDVPPLAVDGFHLDIRRLERNRFSLAALTKNGTLSLEAAAYLYFCILRRRNIVAIGEPGSGKTTLINALDLLTPSYWRKIAVEDAIESIPQRGLGKHQVRLRVEPLEEKKRFLSKGREIVSLLHRTPDLVYLGEIQTASHSRAMFHALSAGLRGLQTCHADSPEQAMVRWVIHHKIPPICLRQIGIIIHMKKVGVSSEGLQNRKVVRICEIKENTETCGKSLDFSSSSVQLVDIFRWNPYSNSLEQKTDLYETPSLKSIVEYEPISKPIFEEEVGYYKSLFQELIQGNEVDISSTTRVFDEISKKHSVPRNEASLL
jgi:type IV secretory pathway ATPase VirB11/archaellum biosynthesis ATPase